MYARGAGVPLDAAKAVAYLSQGQLKGDATALLGLGYCYTHGIGKLEYERYNT
jgi:TPR repeat protein